MLSKHTRTRHIRIDGKKQRAHRVIMARHIGRPLRADEVVHHLDRDPLNNELSNLALMDRAQHEALHAREMRRYPDIKKCKRCGEVFVVNRRKRRRNVVCGECQKWRIDDNESL